MVMIRKQDISIIQERKKISLSICPEGYETEYVGTNYIYLEDGITEYIFEITKK